MDNRKGLLIFETWMNCKVLEKGKSFYFLSKDIKSDSFENEENPSVSVSCKI